MKSIFLILTAGLILSVTTQAQTHKTHKKKKAVVVAKLSVPDNVNASFKNQYATVENNKWSKNYSGNFIADFTNTSSQKQTVEYTAAGQVLKMKTIFDVTALPQNITTALQTNYADAKVTECAKVEIPGVAPYYAVKITTADNKLRQLLISEEGVVTV